MAIGWMTILSNVPWSDVIKNAPAVAEGARKLWKKAGSKASTVSDDAPADSLAALQGQVADLRAQMLAAGEVIQSLAEQNAQLIARVEKTRRRLLLLALANLAIGALALAAWLR